MMMIASFGRYLIYMHSLSTLFAHIKAKFANQGVVCKPRGGLQTKGCLQNQVLNFKLKLLPAPPPLHDLVC